MGAPPHGPHHWLGGHGHVTPFDWVVFVVVHALAGRFFLFLWVWCELQGRPFGLPPPRGAWATIAPKVGRGRLAGFGSQHGACLVATELDLERSKAKWSDHSE